jgi:uncharacterized protein YbaR (Trm112 family)
VKTDLLACPLTHQPLQEAPQAIVDAVNADIARLALRDSTGTLVRVPLDAGLLRADGLLLYPVRGGVAVLFAGAGIVVQQ